MRASAQVPISFCGEAVNEEELLLIQQVIDCCPRLSRTELANTVCELLEWNRPNGGLKTVECRQFLETLEGRSMVQLPTRRAGRPRGSPTGVTHTSSGAGDEPLEGLLGEYPSVSLTLVETAKERALWRELVARYHYLGHRVPFGAHLRYLIRFEPPDEAVLGCLQFSSSAWRMQARDRWIGWDEHARKARLQRIVTNSRFLLLPWVRIRHLASHVLARAARRVVRDWQARYGLAPWLLETLVDPARFSGTCYRAANWIEVGETTGRGRQDRHHRHHGGRVKTIWLYPLRRDARKRLCQGD